MKDSPQTWILAAALALCIQNAAFGQTPTNPIALDAIRAVAGESRSATSKGESVSIASITSVRLTPTLTYPIRLDLLGESGRQRLRITIPPATPAGAYTVQFVGRAVDGQEVSGSLDLVVDAITVPFASSARVPAILLNGWQISCVGTGSTVADSQDTFGQLAPLLQQDGVPVLFFNNCAYGDITIEQLATQLNSYIVSLRYTDGTPVAQVDLVTHSMGGLIARAYLSGKSQVSGTFAPPANHRVHKFITIATPHLGSFLASAYSWLVWLIDPVQAPEMELGSQFLWDLATWNQGHDDLRGVDALAIIGNAGNYYTPANADDGLVSLTSGSLSFAEPDQRTRIVPYCHSTSSWLKCPSHQGIAYVNDSSHPTAQIVLSFLADTTAWQSIGTTPSQDQYLRQYGGVALALKGSNDVYFRDLSSVNFDSSANQLGAGPDSTIASIYYDEFIPAGQHTFFMNHSTGPVTTQAASIQAGGSTALLSKFSPRINAVASSVSTGLPGLTVASGSTIVVTGYGFSSSTTTQLLANGNLLAISQISDQQITAYLPSSYSGLVKLTVSNGNGQHTVNILTAPALFPPSISLSKTLLQFSYMQSGILPQAQTFTITNAGGGTLSWSATPSSQWISLSPTLGTAPATVTVFVNPSSLNPGIYSGTVTVTATGATNTPQVVSVVLTVTAAPPSISLSKTQCQFTYTPGGTAPTPQTVVIANSGGGTLSWTASSSATWLTVSPTFGTAPTTVTVSANPLSLSQGVYNGTITVTASGATNSPQVASVTLTVTATPPSISLSKTQCQFSYLSGGVTPASQAVVVSNAGGGALSWSAASSAQWLSVSPTSGTAPTTLTVFVNPTSLNPGNYNGTVTVTATGATNSPQVLLVALTINAGNSTFFPQVAVGGSDASGGTYSTVFTLLNIGGDQLNGNLILTSQDGTPLIAKLSSGQASAVGFSIAVSLSPGQTTFITATTPDSNDMKLYAGWGRVVSSGGTLNGVATFQLTANSALRTIAGVLSAGSVSQATIPVDDDVALGRFTGYAVANVGSGSIVVSASEISADGKSVTALTDIALAPRQQKAAFFFQDPKAQQKFRGSAVLTGQNGATFAVVALVDNQNLLTAIPVISAKGTSSSSTTFGHLAIGGGYSTVFTLLNTGRDALTGRLMLIGQDGNPLRANMTDGQTSITDSNFPVTIQSGGAEFITVMSVNATDLTKAGWASLSSTGGVLGGVATFQMTASDGTLQTIAGVLSSPPVAIATIPVDDDFSANRFTGYGVANPGSSSITVKIKEISADGTTATALTDIVLAPGAQKAAFIFQDPKANQGFRGSAVLSSQNGATFAVVALVENQNLLTVIPVIPGKAPNIQ